MKIDVKATFGERCMTYEGGAALYDAIHDKLRGGESVELDFAGVRVFASPFFNAAIGRLYADIPADDVAARLRLSNLNPVGEQTIRRVIENSKQYFAGGEAHQRAAERLVEAEPGADEPVPGRDGGDGSR